MAGSFAKGARGKATGGLTLFELIFVLTIIMMLVALLFASLRKVKEFSNRAVCISNLRQIGLAYAMYAENNEGNIAIYKHGPCYAYKDAGIYFGPGLLWDKGYLQCANPYSVLYCPSLRKFRDLELPKSPTGISWFNGYSSRPYGDTSFYGYQGDWGTVTGFRPLLIFGIRNPSSVLLCVDLLYDSAHVAHENGWNGLFVDGHVAWIPDNGDLRSYLTTVRTTFSTGCHLRACLKLEKLNGNTSYEYAGGLSP